MGLFRKKTDEPMLHPPVQRVVHVMASGTDVRAKLAEYGTLWSPKVAAAHVVHVATAGAWTAVRLPAAVHPWQLHNLAWWLLDCPGASGNVVAESGPAPSHPGYVLVPDPEISDALCGWDTTGQGWTVVVPSNEVVWPEPVPVDRSIVVPTGHMTWEPVDVLLEDPGSDMNPTNASNAGSRHRLRHRRPIY